jgi:hypothetical protein
VAQEAIPKTSTSVARADKVTFMEEDVVFMVLATLRVMYQSLRDLMNHAVLTTYPGNPHPLGLPGVGQFAMLHVARLWKPTSGDASGSASRNPACTLRAGLPIFSFGEQERLHHKFQSAGLMTVPEQPGIQLQRIDRSYHQESWWIY